VSRAPAAIGEAPGLTAHTAAQAVEKASSTDQATAIGLVHGWAARVKGPRLPEDAAGGIAAILLRAISTGWWRDEFASAREHDPDVARARRIAAALRALQVDLPPFIETWRGSAASPVPLGSTLALLALVDAHQRVIDAARPRGRGRVLSPERDLAAHLSGLAGTAWGGAGDKARADAFAALAMAWLTGRGAFLSDAAVAKARTRRGHRNGT